MFALMLQGAGFGIAAGTSPGPLLSYLITTTLNHGWRRGVIVLLSPLIADIPIILLMVFILGALPDPVLTLIQIIGGVYVVWLAWDTWQKQADQANQALTAQSEHPHQTISKQQTLIQALGINMLSPGPYIFWGIITGPILRVALNQSLFLGVMFLIAFYGAFLSLLLIWVIVFDRLREINPTISAYILKFSVILLGFLGVVLILQGLGI
jgi:threonine/homoserine/homoserine lactone efflux protein